MWYIDGEVYTEDQVSEMFNDLFGYTLNEVGDMAEQLGSY